MGTSGSVMVSKLDKLNLHELVRVLLDAPFTWPLTHLKKKFSKLLHEWVRAWLEHRSYGFVSQLSKKLSELQGISGGVIVCKLH